MSLFRGPGRMRALLRFALAIAYFIVARFLARDIAQAVSFGAIYPLVRNLSLLFLLLIGYGYMELAFDGARQPLRAMGLVRRPGWQREFALGAAFGWGMMTVIVLGMALAGAIYVHFWWGPRAFILLAIQLGVMAVGSLANEVVFRGYPFQRLIEGMGAFSATVMAGIFFGLLLLEWPGAGTAGIWSSGMAAVLLSVAYLRTRALWLPWGLHFAWLASMGVLFGLPVAGNTGAATVVQTNTYGPLWITGGDYGPEASWLTVLVLIAGLFVLVRATRDLAWQYNLPELRPAGTPVEMSYPAAASPSAKTGPTQAPQLIQIAPLGNTMQTLKERPSACSSSASSAASLPHSGTRPAEDGPTNP